MKTHMKSCFIVMVNVVVNRAECAIDKLCPCATSDKTVDLRTLDGKINGDFYSVDRS